MFNGPTIDSSTLDQNYNIVRTDDVLLVQFNSIFKLNKQKFIAVIVVCDSGGGDGDNNIDKSVNKNNFICFGPSRATRTIPRSHCDGLQPQVFYSKEVSATTGSSAGANTRSPVQGDKIEHDPGERVATALKTRARIISPFARGCIEWRRRRRRRRRRKKRKRRRWARQNYVIDIIIILIISHNIIYISTSNIL